MATYYIDTEDLKVYLGENRLAEISDRMNGETCDHEKICQSIKSAENVINSYLVNTIYQLPIKCSDNSVPSLLVDCALWIATFMMYEGKSTQEVLYRYENALKYLDDLKKGNIGLVCSNNKEPIRISNDEIAEIEVNTSMPKSFFDCLNAKTCKGHY